MMSNKKKLTMCQSIAMFFFAMQIISATSERVQYHGENVVIAFMSAVMFCGPLVMGALLILTDDGKY